jgi:hypothetical protein
MIEFAKLHVEAALENASHQLDLNGTEADDLVILNKMAQTKKQQKEVKQAMLQSPPKDESSYSPIPRTFDRRSCFWESAQSLPFIQSPILET